MLSSLGMHNNIVSTTEKHNIEEVLMTPNLLFYFKCISTVCKGNECVSYFPNCKV